MANNTKFGNAKIAKNNEFYTQLTDIENELCHYTRFFKDKIVFCNCDDPYESNFFYYFATRFNDLRLKKLIATCYDDSPIAYTQLSLFDEGKKLENKNRHPYKIEITEVRDYNKDGATDILDIEYLLRNKKNTITLLKGNGDFRSQECVELLKDCDIVVTNPPYSLFKEFVPLIVKYNKKFVIMGPMNASHYKEIFPLIQNNEMWAGYGFNKTMVFRVPDYYEGFIENGIKYGKVPSICWFTNLEIEKRNEKLILYKKYNKEEYQKYVNFDAIDILKISDIPYDYDGLMGVPDSFLDKYNPDQFEIVGYGRGDFLPQIKTIPQKFLDDYHSIGGKGHITAGMKTLGYYDKDGIPKFPYSRIIIRRKNNED